MRILKLLVMLTAAALVQPLVFAQSATPVSRSSIKGSWEEVGPVAIPTTDTDLITSTRWIASMTLTNMTGADVSCRVIDKQGTPLGMFGSAAARATITNGTALRWEYSREGDRNIRTTSYKMIGGITWSCSAAGVVAFIVWEY